MTDEHEALVAYLRQAPEDDEAWQVLVDLLLARQDPLGELIALDHPFGRHTHVERLRKKLDLYRRNAESLFGIDGARFRLVNEHFGSITTAQEMAWGRIDLEFDHAHVIAVDLRVTMGPDPELVAVLCALIRRPICQFLQRLEASIDEAGELKGLEGPKEPLDLTDCSPSLQSVRISAPRGPVMTLGPEHLPRLRSLSIEMVEDIEPLVRQLAEGPFRHQLTELSFAGCTVSAPTARLVREHPERFADVPGLSDVDTP